MSNDIINITTRKSRKNKNKKQKPVVKRIGRLLQNVRQLNSQRTNQPKRHRRKMPSDWKGFRQTMKINSNPRNLGGKSGFGNKKSIIISEEEYVCEINSNNSSTAFFLPAAQQFGVNPGQVSLFPWLSTIAANYQKYQFLDLEFIYQPEVTPYAPSGANTGKVILCAEYNSALGPPNNKEDMEDINPNANDLPYKNIYLKMDPSEMHKNSDAKFIRSAGLPGGSDIKTYDCANLFIAAQGQNVATTALGELHVRYTVKLFDPIILGQLGLPNNYTVTNLFDSKQGLTTATPYQPLLAAVASTSLPVVNGIGVVNTAGSIVPPIGNYLLTVGVTFYVTGSDYSQMLLNVLKNAVVQAPSSGTSGTAVFGNTGAATQ